MLADAREGQERMKRRGFLARMIAVGIAALGVAMVQPVRAQDSADKVKTDIQAIVEKYTKGLEGKKFIALSELFTEDWKGTNVVGDSASRNSLIENWSNVLAEAAEIKVAQEMLGFTTEKDTAKALLKTTSSANYTGGDGNTLKAGLTQVILVTYTRTAAGWKMSATQDLSEQTTLNGMPIAAGEAPEESEPHKAIQAKYTALADAIKAGNKEAVAKWFPEGFVSVGADGTETKREQFLDYLNNLIQNSKFEELTIHVERVRYAAGKATAHCTIRVKADDTSSGTTHKAVVMMATQDTFTKEKGASGPDAWKPVQFRTLYQEMSIDGKAEPVQPQLSP
jgi:ketosteroid isomerase-like protein